MSNYQTSKNLLITFLLIGFCFSLLVSFVKPTNNHKLPVGSVVYSILPPDVFFNENGKDNWMLLNGNELNKTSELYKLIERNRIKGILDKNGSAIPDSRGYFIRSMNYQGGFDIDKNRIVGRPQDELTKKPKNNFITKDGIGNLKSLELSRITASSRADGELRSLIGNREAQYRSRWLRGNNVTYGYAGNYPSREGHVVVTNVNPGAGGNPGHHQQVRDALGVNFLKNRTNATIEIVGGDVETRPKNIALFTYIKIE